MIPAWMLGAAMLRANGVLWAKQIEVAQVFQAAAMKQTRAIWGLSRPPVFAGPCAPAAAGPVQRTRRKPPPAEVEDVPV